MPNQCRKKKFVETTLKYILNSTKLKHKKLLKKKAQTTIH